MKTYPICLIGLEGRQAVVVGGGSVAVRKAAGLLEAGAQVTVVSPFVSPELRALAASDATRCIRFLERPYQDGDLENAFLVIAATDDSAVNEAVWQEASRRGCLVNVVDDPARCNFILPAVVRRDELTIAVSTGGASPVLARRLREQLEAQFGPDYGLLSKLMAELRPELLARFPPGKPRLQAALRLIDSDLLQVIHSQGYQAARTHAECLLQGTGE